ncbi:DUF192 domain-containing protein [Candidatus Saccharibacteria bacterium]|nr:DUF192 domain-containing protein [Candidatus Saccharibacteria bacterium]
MSKWRSHTTSILVVGIIAILCAAVTAFLVAELRPKTDVTLGSRTFNSTVADTETGRQKGLSGITTLGPNDGLLMVFPDSQEWGIWMKDMKVPIDIMWLDEDRIVVHIVMDASPEIGDSKTFVPTKPALYVLEVAAGTVESAGIKIGDRANFRLEGEK